MMIQSWDLNAARKEDTQYVVVEQCICAESPDVIKINALDPVRALAAEIPPVCHYDSRAQCLGISPFQLCEDARGYQPALPMQIHPWWTVSNLDVMNFSTIS